MSKHTPWPWRIEEGESTIYTCMQIKAANGESLMGDEKYYPWVPSNLADWHLIAAAPELLDFAKEWLAQQGSDNNYMTQKAKEAIAKAEGKQ